MPSPTSEIQLPQTALVGFILQRQFIEQKLALGHTKTAIWKALVDAKLIDMSYNHFRRLCNSQLGHRKRQVSPTPREERQVASDDTSSPSPSKPAGRGPVANRPTEKKKFEVDLNLVDREFT